MVEYQLASAPVIDSQSFHRGRRDLVRVVESAYQFDRGDREWLLGVLRAARDSMELGSGVAAWFFRVDAALETMVVRDPIFLGCPPDSEDVFGWATRELDFGAVYHEHFLSQTCTTLSQVLRDAAADDEARARRARVTTRLRESGIVECRLVRVDFEPGIGCMLAALSPEAGFFPRRLASSLERVAVHVSAAFRLRQSLMRPPEALPASEPPSAPPPDERLGGAWAGEPLDRAVLELARGRSTEGDAAEERALDLWRGLVAGRWSLVHHVDRDGRRVVLARRNGGNTRDPAALSPRERAVTSLAARGASVKLIAYELGLAPSTVSEHLTAGLRKLHLGSRAELSRLFARGS